MNKFSDVLPNNGETIVAHKTANEDSDAVIAFRAGEYILDRNSYEVIYGYYVNDGVVTSINKYSYWESVDSFLYRTLERLSNKNSKEIIYNLIKKNM